MSKHSKGEVWKVNDRHGKMTIKLLEDVDESKDGFFQAEIVEGQKHYLSDGWKSHQDATGEGTQGTVSSFRTGLCKFKERLDGKEEEDKEHLSMKARVVLNEIKTEG